MKKNRKMSTCKWLDLKTLGSLPGMLKILPKYWCQHGGGFLTKGRIKGTNYQLQAPFDDQPWNEMKFNQLYEINRGNLQSPTQMHL